MISLIIIIITITLFLSIITLCNCSSFIQVQGTHTRNILVQSLLAKTRYLFNPFCFKGSKIRIIVEGIEDGRGLKVAKKLMVPIKSDSVSFEFADDASKFFRPGLPYTVKVNCLLQFGYY